ncbi:MAG TPA: DUF4321 domain-containing protein [Clostridiales bacterium]|nr:DUF4321 domain-containing protein [Clostridiales bacterium]
MRLRGRSQRNPWTLVLFLLAGLIIGGVVGDILSSYFSLFDYTYKFGIIDPIGLDLRVITITFGLIFNLNLGSAIGVVIGIISYMKS